MPTFSEEMWQQLRRKARDAADQALREAAENLVQGVFQDDNSRSPTDLELTADLEQRLDALNMAWPIHNKPLLSRIPLLGPLLTRLTASLVRFLLQHQISFNAEATRTLQEMYRLQRLIAQEQIARSDDFFARLDEALLGLEARIRDLEQELAHLRQKS